MTRQETGIIMDILTTAYPRFYAGPDAPDMRKAISLWAEMFADDDVAVVAAAVKALIVADSREFPPLIGTVKEKIRQLTAPNAMAEAEAWNLVARAVKNGIYGAKEEFEKLPENIKHLVGSPSQLKDWAMMDSDSLHSVVASNFQRSYKAVSKREQEKAKLPADVQRLINGVSGRLELEAGRVQ